MRVYKKISVTPSKKQNPLSNLFIHCISAALAPQILSIKNECTFCFSNFQIIPLCNSSVNRWFDIFSFLT